MLAIRIGLGILALLVAVGAYFIASAFMEAYIEVNNKPRQKMFWCWKHGMFPEKETLDAGFTKLCPVCYRDAYQKAQQM